MCDCGAVVLAMIAIRGAGSRIAEELRGLLPKKEKVLAIPRGETPPFDADRYLFCQGLLRAKPTHEQSADERDESLDVNAHQIMNACDVILGGNAKARICIIGSESAFVGSFDGTYAWGKLKLHRYIEAKKLKYPEQQLVCIAPGIIINSGMTERRNDLGKLEQRRMAHPKRRWLMAKEVARLVHFCLYVDEGYLSNTVVRLNGGEHLWR